jgi:hypothetical protein
VAVLDEAARAARSWRSVKHAALSKYFDSSLHGTDPEVPVAERLEKKALAMEDRDHPSPSRRLNLALPQPLNSINQQRLARFPLSPVYNPPDLIRVRQASVAGSGVCKGIPATGGGGWGRRCCTALRGVRYRGGRWRARW